MSASRLLHILYTQIYACNVLISMTPDLLDPTFPDRMSNTGKIVLQENKEPLYQKYQTRLLELVFASGWAHAGGPASLGIYPIGE